jgi:hypothetical protein
MGRKSVGKERKQLTKKVHKWLADLLVELQDQDIQSLTIDDIAKLAGKSKSTIYEYFERKEDILLAVCQTRTTFLSKHILERLPITNDPRITYHFLMEEFSNGISDISISFLQKIKLHYPSAWTVIDTFINLFIQLLRDLYQKGIEGGYFNSISIELMTHIDKFFVTEVVTNQSLFSNSEYSLSSLVRDYLKLRLDGLGIK